jgi:hypothetical protein
MSLRGVKYWPRVLVTGIVSLPAAPLLTIAADRMHEGIVRQAIMVFITPALFAGGAIGEGLNRLFPPRENVWLAGLGTLIVSVAVVLWLEIWAILLGAATVWMKLTGKKAESK